MSLFGALLLGAAATAHVPFVGCPSDGQAGPFAAPRARQMPAVPVAVAPRLAWYASEYEAVLAPRGWRCFALYGSDGGVLFVAPERLSFARLNQGGPGLAGPVVAIGNSEGGTSGRFEVVDFIARYFPRYRSYIRHVRQMMGFDIGPIPRGPWPADRFLSRNATEVRLTTPAGRRGEGTSDRLAPNRNPVESLILLDPRDEMNVTVIKVRLTRRDASLIPSILAEARRGVVANR